MISPGKNRISCSINELALKNKVYIFNMSDLEEILDEDQQEELKEYFLESESEDISDALKEFDGDYDEEELRLYRIKFLNDVSN